MNKGEAKSFLDRINVLADRLMGDPDKEKGYDFFESVKVSASDIVAGASVYNITEKQGQALVNILSGLQKWDR